MPSFPRRASGPSTPPLPFLTSARAGALFLDERGAATAEYAVATMATVASLRHFCQTAAAYTDVRAPYR